MTASLKRAFDRAASLPRAAQDQLAEQLVREIEGELKWEQSLAESQPLLERLARRALEQQKAGKTRAAGFDEL